MKIKIALRYHITPTRLGKSKSLREHSDGEAVGRQALSFFFFFFFYVCVFFLFVFFLSYIEMKRP